MNNKKSFWKKLKEVLKDMLHIYNASSAMEDGFDAREDLMQLSCMDENESVTESQKK